MIYRYYKDMLTLYTAAHSRTDTQSWNTRLGELPIENSRVLLIFFIVRDITYAIVIEYDISGDLSPRICGRVTRKSNEKRGESELTSGRAIDLPPGS